MAIHGLLRLPTTMITVILLQLIFLSHPTFSLGLSPRRLWTPLRAAGGTYEGEDVGGETGGGIPDASKGNSPSTTTASSSSSSSRAANPFERVVRSVTRNEDYKFGDITRTVVNSTTTGVEGTVRAVTGNEDYHFGDLTKSAIGSTAHGVEGIVKSVTGNEDYHFGDLTRNTVGAAGSIMTYSEKTLKMMRDNNIHELVELLNLYWNKSMNYDERKETFWVFVYLGAILVLSYNFVANTMSGMVFAAAWARTSLATGTSPLSPGMWGKFLETKATLDLFFGGPCLPARAIVTIPWFFSYRKFVVASAHKSPLREKFPIINRCASLLLSYVVGNLAFVGGFTYTLVKMISLWTGVPVFPVAS